MTKSLVRYSYNKPLGYKITCLAAAEDTVLPLRFVTFGKTYKEIHVNWPASDKCLIIYSEKGLGKAFIDGKWVELSPGDVVYWPPNRPIKYEPVSDEPWQVTFFSYTGRNAESMLGLNECLIKSEEMAFIPEFVDKLTEKHDKNDFQEFSIGGLCYLLLKIRRLTRDTEGSAKKVSIAKRLSRSIKYVTEHATEELSVAALAEECGTSEVYYCRMFKQITGTTPTGYINALRISRACDLLQENPDSKIEEISRACGFNHITYFNKIFKRETEINPTEFKAEHKE